MGDTQNLMLRVATPLRTSRWARPTLAACALVAAQLLGCGAAVTGGVGSGQGVVVQVTPPEAQTPPRTSIPFQAAVTGTTTLGVTWSVTEPTGGTVTQAGAYTAPAGTWTFHVRATSLADPSVWDEAAVTVTGTPVIAVYVTPRSPAVALGQTLSFYASVTGTTVGQSTAVTWSATGGTISSTGVYTPSSAGSFQVTATSVADPTKFDRVPVTVTNPVPSSGRWVMGYWAAWGWNWGGPQPTFDGTALTHVAIAHVLTTASGGLTYGTGLSSLAQTNNDRPLPGTA